MHEFIACIIIYDRHGRVFLQHRDADAPTDPNMWCFWGGHSEEGETPEGAAARELKEETGIEARADELVFMREYQGRRVPWYVFLYEAPEPLVYTQTEGDYCGWFSVTEIPKLPMVPLARDAVLDFFASKV